MYPFSNFVDKIPDDEDWLLVSVLTTDEHFLSMGHGEAVQGFVAVTTTERPSFFSNLTFHSFKDVCSTEGLMKPF